MGFELMLSRADDDLEFAESVSHGLAADAISNAREMIVAAKAHWERKNLTLRQFVMSKEQIALTIFTALLPRALDKADKMAFPEGALNRMKLEISAAWAMADLWISERQDSDQSADNLAPAPLSE